MPNVLTTMHQSSSLVYKTSVNYQPILGSFFTDQNSAGCCSSNGEGYGNNKSHSTPWKLLNSVLKGSLVIEACRITTISMAKLMQQNTQFQQPKNMPGPGKEFVWTLTCESAQEGDYTGLIARHPSMFPWKIWCALFGDVCTIVYVWNIHRTFHECACISYIERLHWRHKITWLSTSTGQRTWSSVAGEQKLPSHLYSRSRSYSV